MSTSTLAAIGLAAVVVGSGMAVYGLVTLIGFLTHKPVDEKLSAARVVLAVLTMVGVTELFLTGVW